MAKLSFIKRLPNTEIVHYYSEGAIIKSKFNKVYVKVNGYECKVKLPISSFEAIFGLFRITRRALRLDKCNVFLAKTKLVIIRRNWVYSYDLESKELTKTLQLKNCRNVLHQSLCFTPNGNMFFGEYGNNGERKPVNVYKSSDLGVSWQVAYQFPAGEIKHIHGCYYDSYEKKVWTLTGDFKGENIIMKSDEDFKENVKIGDGSQKYRAVSIFFQKDTVHWIMDSPIEKSYHYVMDRNTHEIERKSLFPGPVWYLKELSDGCFLAATSVEIGEGVMENKACLFASKDLESWERVAEYPKDILPMRYFKWGVIGLADGVQNSRNFAVHFEALKKVDGKSYIAKLDE